MDKIIKIKKTVKGEIFIPGDKSVSHRAVMFGAIAEGNTRVTNFLKGADCLATIDCFQKLGIQIEENKNILTIKGKGLFGLKGCDKELYTANSGTTTRLLSGILSGQNFDSNINGDESIQKRPMKRIIEPLRLMGADISAVNDNLCPLKIKGKKLKGIDYTLPVASAQLKSCIMFAGLYAEDTTIIREKHKSRNHTELMLKAFGGNIVTEKNDVFVKGSFLKARDVAVPSDISSAAYFMVLTLISNGGELLIKNIGVNPTRTGIIDVLKEMGGHIELLNISEDIEPVCDIYVKASKLKGVNIGGEIIPRLIDELPILSVAAAYAEGKTVISGAQELKFKESNRIKTIVEEIGKCGAVFTETEDGLIIEGTDNIKGAVYNSYNDHRIAMSAAVAATFANSESKIIDAECVFVSYPGFYESLESLLK